VGLDRIELRAISLEGMFDEIIIWSSVGPRLGLETSVSGPDAGERAIWDDIPAASPVVIANSPASPEPTPADAEAASFEFDDDARTASILVVAGLVIWAALFAGRSLRCPSVLLQEW
jgi:hypothetical protein